MKLDESLVTQVGRRSKLALYKHKLLSTINALPSLCLQMYIAYFLFILLGSALFFICLVTDVVFCNMLLQGPGL